MFRAHRPTVEGGLSSSVHNPSPCSFHLAPVLSQIHLLINFCPYASAEPCITTPQLTSPCQFSKATWQPSPKAGSRGLQLLTVWGESTNVIMGPLKLKWWVDMVMSPLQPTSDNVTLPGQC